MTPDASEDDLVARLIAAPARERRLTAAQRKKQSRRVVLPAPASFSASSVRATAVRPGSVGSVESKLAALDDPADILQLIGTEAALRRAQRLSGGGEQQRHLIRLLSVVMLFALAIAAVGAMWWLQTGLSAGHRRPRALTPASPAPAASASPVVPTRRSPAPER